MQSNAIPWPASDLSLTAAQLSRAAAQAVRLSAPREALYIVNSLHYSTFPLQDQHAFRPQPNAYPVTSSHSALPSNTTTPPAPIEFGKPISPRLAAHSFLHLLLRRGQLSEAAEYAELMMQQGIRLRTNTTQVILESLCNPVSVLHPSTMIEKFKVPFKASRTTLQLPKDISHPGTGAAFRILQYAREFGQHRSERMYETLMSALLLQGEILIGSLLFVLLVKDWQAYKARRETTDRLDADSVTAYPGLGHTVEKSRTPSRAKTISHTRHLNSHCMVTTLAKQPSPSPPPYPSRNLLRALVDEIDFVLSQDPINPGDDEYLQEPLQALASLVSQLENGGLHSRHMSSVMHTIQNCPKTEHEVSIERYGGVLSVKAYPYFHDFLAGLIASFKATNWKATKQLDLSSCNTLLHYALRHRMSPALASGVLDHICTHFKPTIVTINILLRSGTLLRRMDIAGHALEVLRESSDMRALLDAGPPPMPEVVTATKGHATKLKLDDGMRRLFDEQFDMPAQMLTLCGPLQSDLYSLLAYIQHLTATGLTGIAASCR